MALKIRMVDATTPNEYRTRVSILDRDVRDQYEAIGFEAGRSSCPCRRSGIGSGFGHQA